MMHLPIPFAKELVLVGGGHTHALFLRHWGMNRVHGARLTLINPAPTAPYTGMLPGFVAGHYDQDELEIDLVKLARFAGARLIFGRVDALDLEARALSVTGRPDIDFDYVSIDIGITSDMPEVPGFAEHGVPAKPLGPFAQRWRAFLDGDAGDVAVIGAGVAGVELALTMNHALGARGAVTLVDSAGALSTLRGDTRRKLLGRMTSSGIGLIENARVRQISGKTIQLEDGRTLNADLTVGAAGARPFPWLETTGLALNEGFIAVDDTLRSISHPRVYATGDCAHLTGSPRPKAGVFAVRAAPILYHNLKAELTGGKRRRFRPQRNYLKLISLGPEEALAEKWGHSLSGTWAWYLKDRIDRSFLKKLSDLPRMTRPTLPKPAAIGVAEAMGPKPLCGGCGAKVGPGTLDRALARLQSFNRADVETFPGDDAAILRLGDVRQSISTDHLRAFWDDPWLMSRITAVHALNDIFAMGADPQVALAQITLPPMAEPMQEKWLAEILDGANSILSAEKCSLVGGHTSVGPELTLGFTITGLVGERPLSINGAQKGDALILTDPIGSGTLLAAEMEGRAKGADVAFVLETLARPRGAIARALARYASALTDVTGFGLGGHLARMARASNLSAEIAIDDVPLYPGALELAEAGVRSTVWASNRAAVEATLPDTPLAALLFDPQTAGGFLAAVSPANVEKALKDCREAGADARLIGQMTVRSHVTLKAR